MKDMAAVNEVHLSGADTQIVFHNGEDEAMRLEYNGKVFEGRALSRENTALGLIVSVLLEAIPDLRTVSLCVVIPAANCPADMRSIGVSTFAVLTTGRTSIGGPGLVSGQLQEYKVVPLEGNAW